MYRTTIANIMRIIKNCLEKCQATYLSHRNSKVRNVESSQLIISNSKEMLSSQIKS